MDDLIAHDFSKQIAVQTDQKFLLGEPRLYYVLLLNDDYTPMEFVVEVLKKFFHYGEDEATKIMLDIHNNGKALCGLFTHEIAETKVVMVNDYARAYEHPLLCVMKPE